MFTDEGRALLEAAKRQVLELIDKSASDELEAKQAIVLVVTEDHPQLESLGATFGEPGLRGDGVASWLVTREGLHGAMSSQWGDKAEQACKSADALGTIPACLVIPETILWLVPPPRAN